MGLSLAAAIARQAPDGMADADLPYAPHSRSIDRPAGMKIAIVGAGLGGLTAAIALRRAGHEVAIHEQSRVLGDVGAGITITPNAWKGLASLGLEAAMTARADDLPQQAIRTHDTGTPILEIPRGPVTLATYGAPYAMFHRADLHALLVEAVGVDAIALGEAVDDVATLDADAVIAADGVRSGVRSRLFDDPAARFTGHVAWRGLVPAGDLPPGASAPGSVVWAGPGRIFVRYPVRRGDYRQSCRVDPHRPVARRGLVEPRGDG